MSSSLATVVKTLLSQLDARTVSIRSTEGHDLITDSRGGVVGPDDMQLISNLTSNYAASIDQGNQLELGTSKYSLSWASGSIIVQMKVEAAIITLVFEEDANLGMINEYINDVEIILSPVCKI